MTTTQAASSIVLINQANGERISVDADDLSTTTPQQLLDLLLESERIARVDAASGRQLLWAIALPAAGSGAVHELDPEQPLAAQGVEPGAKLSLSFTLLKG